MPPVPASPLGTLWQPGVLLSVVLGGEGIALLLAFAPGVAGSRSEYFALASLTIQWVSMLTLGTLYAARQRLSRLRPPAIAHVALAICLLHTLVVLTIGRLALGEHWLESGGWTQMTLRLMGMSTVLGLLGLAAFQNHWSAQKAAVRTKQAELEALQARIHPHFLFNTLNTAAALVHQRPQDAEQLLLDLADLFRAALAGPRDVLLSEELALTRRYLEIEMLRFGDRLRVDWDVPREIPRMEVPALSLQPLVENAIRHGVERIATGGRVTITLMCTLDDVLIRVMNPLVLSDARAHESHRVGLSASRARVAALTGGKGSVETSIQGEHFLATIRLPRPRPANRRM